MKLRFSALPACGLLALGALTIRAQGFDVASIKPDLSGSGGAGINRHHGSFNAENVTVRMLVEFAFEVNIDQIVGAPAWIGADKYDVIAKTDASVDTDDQFRPLTRALLADRFRLKLHRDTAQLPIYSLVVAKGGSKMTAHTGEGGPSTNLSTGSGKTGSGKTGSGKGSIRAVKASTKAISEILSRAVGRSVVDNTRLAGEFDFTLEWSPDEVANPSLPSIFTALQEQAGLRLESTKGPVEVIVVDSVAKPSEN